VPVDGVGQSDLVFADRPAGKAAASNATLDDLQLWQILCG
jgi:hypothetical protein